MSHIYSRCYKFKEDEVQINTKPLTALEDTEVLAYPFTQSAHV